MSVYTSTYLHVTIISEIIDHEFGRPQDGVYVSVNREKRKGQK